MKQGHLGDERAQARLKGQAKLRAQEREDDLRNVMATPHGRRVLWRLIEGWSPDLIGTFSLSMTGNSQTFFNEGNRAVGVRVMQELQRVEPDKYVLMLTEQLQRQKLDEIQRKDAIAQAAKADDT